MRFANAPVIDHFLDASIEFCIARGRKRCVQRVNAATCEILHEQI
jgi:hypothetical protein